MLRVLLVWHSTRTQFLHASAITADEHRNFQHLPCADRLHGCTASCVRTRSRHISLAGLFAISRNKDDMGDGVPTWHTHCDCTDSHCTSHIVASCVFVLLVSTLITRRRRRVLSTMSTAPSSSARASFVSHVKTHLTTFSSQGRQLRTGRSDVYQQPIAGLTLLALWCPIGAAPRVNVDFSSRCGAPFFSVSHTITRPADHRRQGHAHGSLPQCLLPTRVPSTMSTSLCASSWVSSTIKSMSSLGRT